MGRLLRYRVRQITRPGRAIEEGAGVLEVQVIVRMDRRTEGWMDELMNSMQNKYSQVLVGSHVCLVKVCFLF